VKLMFSEHAWEDYVYWQRTDRKILERINTLRKESQCTPFEGMGKPEPLKHGLSGYWSRRVNDEHRMVYKVEADVLFLAQLRYHY
jgi:toxin YoeB